MNKQFKIKLFKHGGCEGCIKKCIYNSLGCDKEVSERTKGMKFNCNSSKG
jgi:hypothetical protein